MPATLRDSCNSLPMKHTLTLTLLLATAALAHRGDTLFDGSHLGEMALSQWRGGLFDRAEQ